jgi:hypothetical protein
MNTSAGKDFDHFMKGLPPGKNAVFFRTVKGAARRVVPSMDEEGGRISVFLTDGERRGDHHGDDASPRNDGCSLRLKRIRTC